MPTKTQKINAEYERDLNAAQKKFREAFDKAVRKRDRALASLVKDKDDASRSRR